MLLPDDRYLMTSANSKITDLAAQRLLDFSMRDYSRCRDPVYGYGAVAQHQILRVIGINASAFDLTASHRARIDPNAQ